ncbi:hypothetical protein NESM_000899300 [Novymonas esmeraldas]|uniref:EGF-like domain-containing protein n=1 Tax=Novymonas esmeraldas TaxID=1808958 RepID=A0AAW0F0L9_9TRYP
MSRVLCRLLLVAAVAAAVLACTARAACDAQCKTCGLGICVGCNTGYYLSGQTCTACPVERCRDCVAFGVCTSCMDGYTLTFLDDGSNKTASSTLKGTCKSAAELKCSDTRCKNCVGGHCVACEDGYYLVNGTCTSCKTANCAHCELAGRCITCKDGYRIKYVSNATTGPELSKYGECVNGARLTHTIGTAALVAVVAALTMLA